MDNNVTGKIITIVSGPPYKYKLRVFSKNKNQEIILDRHTMYNSSNKNNEEYLMLWSEIWNIIINKKEVNEKLPDL